MMNKRLLTICVGISLFSVSNFSFLCATEARDNSKAEDNIASVLNLNAPTTYKNNDFVHSRSYAQEDADLLDAWMQDKGFVSSYMKAGQLTISGEFRATALLSSETINGVEVRGILKDSQSRYPLKKLLAANYFKTSAAIALKYTLGRSWGIGKFKMTRYGGSDGGSATTLSNEQALIGYRFNDPYPDDSAADPIKGNRYIEVGLDSLGNLFDSKIQFKSDFGGIHLYFAKNIDCHGMFLVHGGPFVIDSATNHYGGIIETGLLNIEQTAFSAKYSFITWKPSGKTLAYDQKPLSKEEDRFLLSPDDNVRYQFAISQLAAKYTFLQGCSRMPIELNSMILVNHAAKQYPKTPLEKNKENVAFYAGVTLGKAEIARDCSFNLCYQIVQAQSVPEFDISGPGRGNSGNDFLSWRLQQARKTPMVDAYAARGFSNFQGFGATGVYLASDNLSCRFTGWLAIPENKKLGGDFEFKELELSLIYAF